ncbi:MAG TPA: iron-containing alcohol dehydrogenase [Polyangia bacterium]
MTDARATLHLPPLYTGAAVEPLLAGLDPERTVVFVDPVVRDALQRLGRPFAHVLKVGAATAEEVTRLRALLPALDAPALALGGGRVLDVAKLVVRGETADGLPRPRAGASAPLIAIPTTCGSGAEASSVAVVTVGRVKRPIVGPALRPSAIVHLPELITSLTPAQRAAGLFDAVSHLVEGGCSPLASDAHVTLAALLLPRALGLLQTAVGWTPRDCGEALLTATLAGAIQDVTSVGLAHALAHALEPGSGLGHGVLCAAFLVPVVRWNREKSPKFDELCARAGLAAEDTLERLDVLASLYGFRRPPVPRSPEVVTALVRDPCARTNCRAARPADLTRLLETL